MNQTGQVYKREPHSLQKNYHANCCIVFSVLVCFCCVIMVSLCGCPEASCARAAMVQEYQSPVRVYKHPFELIMAVS